MKTWWVLCYADTGKLLGLDSSVWPSDERWAKDWLYATEQEASNMRKTFSSISTSPVTVVEVTEKDLEEFL